MSVLVIEGSQWGDEGKGKITDYFAQQADVVVRSQGGNNAGHTITINNTKFALRSIPSGIFNPNIKNILASGMVINPKQMLEELHGLESRGITSYKLYISNRAHIVLPYHEALDQGYEEFKGKKKLVRQSVVLDHVMPIKLIVLVSVLVLLLMKKIFTKNYVIQ